MNAVGYEIREVAGKGLGVFSTKEFIDGERIMFFTGRAEDVSMIKDLDHSLQVGERAFIGPTGGADDLVNHSCSPNTGLRMNGKKIELVAIENVKPGDEITWDYSTTMYGGLWAMECVCGNKNCRGTVLDFDDLPKDRKDFYLSRNVVMPYLRRNQTGL